MNTSVGNPPQAIKTQGQIEGVESPSSDKVITIIEKLENQITNPVIEQEVRKKVKFCFDDVSTLNYSEAAMWFTKLKTHGSSFSRSEWEEIEFHSDTLGFPKFCDEDPSVGIFRHLEQMCEIHFENCWSDFFTSFSNKNWRGLVTLVHRDIQKLCYKTSYNQYELQVPRGKSTFEHLYHTQLLRVEIITSEIRRNKTFDVFFSFSFKDNYIKSNSLTQELRLGGKYLFPRLGKRFDPAFSPFEKKFFYRSAASQSLLADFKDIFHSKGENVYQMNSMLNYFVPKDTVPNALDQAVEQLGSKFEEVANGAVTSIGTKVGSFAKVGGIALWVYGVSEVIIGYNVYDNTLVESGLKKIAFMGVIALTQVRYQGFSSAAELYDYCKELMTKTCSEWFSLSNMPDIKNWFKSLILFERALKSVEVLTQFLLDNVKGLAVFLYNHNVLPSKLMTRNIKTTEMALFLDKSYEFLTDLRNNKISVSVSSIADLTGFIESGRHYVGSLDKAHGLGSVVTKMVEELTVHREKMMEVMPFYSSLRKEPTSILFSGAPRIGKSLLVSKLSDDIHKTLSADFQRFKDVSVYHCNLMNKHFDGYVNANICVLDDFAQSKDTAGGEDSEFKRWIMIYNTIPYLLPMADLPSKGRTKFVSDAIIGTSNAKTFQVEGVISAAAVHDRWDLHYIAYPKLEYCADSSVDRMERKLKPDMDPSIRGKPEEYLEFFNLRTNTICTYKEVLQIYVSKWMYKEQFFNDLNRMRSRGNGSCVKMFTDTDFLNLTNIVRLAYELESTECTESDLDIGVDLLMKQMQKLDDDVFDTLFKNCKSRDDFFDAFILGRHHLELVNKIRRQNQTIAEKWSSGIKNSCENLKQSIANVNEWRIKLKDSNPYYKYIEMLGLASAILGLSGLLGFGAYKSIQKRREECLESEKSERVREPIYPDHLQNKPQSSEVLQPQVQLSPQQLAQAVKEYQMKNSADFQMGAHSTLAGQCQVNSLHKNVFSITDEDENLIGFCTGIKGYVAMAPKHFVTTFQKSLESGLCNESDPLYFTKGLNSYNWTVGEFVKSVYYFGPDDGDTCFFVHPPVWGQNKDISSKFKNENSFLEYYPDSSLIAFHSSRKLVQTKDICRGTCKLNLSYPMSDGKCLRGVYTYNHKTMSGDCGALLFDDNPKTQEKIIIGTHVAGNINGFGGAVRISSELITTALSKLSGFPLLERSDPSNIYQMGSTNPRLKSIFEYQYEVQKAGGLAKSSYTSSPPELFGLYGPPNLVPSDVHMNRTYEAVRNRSTTNRPFVPQDVVDRTLSNVSYKIFKNSEKMFLPRLLSYQEMISGTEFGYTSQLSVRKSAGYPFVLETGGKKGKTKWFGDGDIPTLDTPAFKDLDLLIQQRKIDMLNNIRPRWVFMINLKDEPRKIGKKTRAFGAGPLDLTMLCMEYFGAFVGWFQLNKIDNGSTLGINYYSAEWNYLAIKLTFEKLLAGDFKGFDELQNPYLISGILSHVIERYYWNSTPQDRKIRQILMLELINCFYYFDGNVYESFSNMPSGHFLTAVVNTIFCMCCYEYTFGMVTNWMIDASIHDKIWVIKCNGDDSIGGVCDEFIQIFNESVMSKWCEKIGCIYTSDDKSATNSEGRKLSEVSFLKRKFRFEKHLNIYVGPMLWERLREFPNLMKKINGMEILEKNLNKFLVELSLHGEEFFNEQSVKLIDPFLKTFGKFPDETRWFKCLQATTKGFYLTNQYQMGSLANSSGILSCKFHRFKIRELSKKENIKNMNSTINRNICDKNDIISQRDIISSETTVGCSSYQMNDTNAPPIEDIGSDIKFVGSADVVSERVPFSDRNRYFEDTKAGFVDTDLIRILKKPCIVESGNFASSDVATTFTKHSWFDHINSSTMIQNKISGILSLRASLKLRLLVNANSFQRGLYMLVYIPTGGLTSGSVSETYWLLQHAANLSHLTQLPHVFFDINCESEVELTIPFNSAYNSVPLSTSMTNGCPGVYFIYPVFPLQVPAGVTTAAFTLYASLEDIELGTVNYPQMGKKTGPRKKDVLAKEADSLKPSDILKIGSDMSTMASKIPLLSTFAGPLAWGLNAASKSAASFGFSKPTMSNESHRIFRGLYSNMANVEAEDQSEVLALTRNNHVSIDGETFNTDLDEMSKNFLVNKWTWTENLTWATSNAKDSAIFIGTVTPDKYTTTVDSTRTLTHYSPMGFLNYRFINWRGNLKVRFKFCKTSLHSGRLLFTFNPSWNGLGSNLVNTNLKSEYVIREVIDMSEVEDVTIEIPYIFGKPWCSQTSNTGYINLIVLDPISAPATVNSTIPIMVMWSGTDSLEFSSPGNSDLTTIVPSSYQMGDFKPGCGVKETLSNAPSLNALKICEDTQGEIFTSLRQLIKRSEVYCHNFVQIDAGGKIFGPFLSWSQYCTGAAVVNSPILQRTSDMYSFLMGAYCYSRGGVRIRTIFTTDLGGTCIVASDHIDAGGPLNAVFTTTGTFGTVCADRNGSAVSHFNSTSIPSGFLFNHSTRILNRLNALETCYNGAKPKAYPNDSDSTQGIIAASNPVDPVMVQIGRAHV